MVDFMNKLIRTLIRLLAGAAVFIAALFVPLEGYMRLILFIPSYLIIAADILYRAFRNILKGQIFDENFLMTLATIGAFIIGEYPEAVTVMLFYQVGEMFQRYAVSKSRNSIKALMNIRPDYANIEKEGKVIKVDPYEININDIIIVRPGEKIPLDGIVIDGNSLIDTSAITGESVPREVYSGRQIISGCVNLSGILRIQVTKTFDESTVSKILDLVENASSEKANTENFITKFARYYTPVVVFSALALAVIPPLFTGFNFSAWISRALIFLVVSCPCALVISVPMSFFGGIGGSAKQGILIKGSNYIEALAKSDVFVFDKTGTLTKGTFEVTQIHPKNLNKEKLLEYAAMAEAHSNHPISKSLKKAYAKEIDSRAVSDYEEIFGKGVKAKVNAVQIYAGNSKLMEQTGIHVETVNSAGTVVYVAADNEYCGYIVISDEIKPEAFDVVNELKKRGISNTVLLTGDMENTGIQVAEKLGIDKAYCELLPADKVNIVERLIKEKEMNKKLVFVGDGINDAPVLARADIGIAMGAMGSDAAIEAADIVIMDDNIQKLPKAVDISRKTLKIVKQNIVFALAVKILVLLFGAIGIASMWAAVFADVGVSVIAIINAMRALKCK